MDVSELKELLKNLSENEIVEIDKELISELMAVLNSDASNSYTPKEFAKRMQNLRNDISPSEFELCRKAILLKIAILNIPKIFSESYPISVQKMYTKTFQRFIRMCSSSKGWAIYPDDVYWKDLAMARQVIFPAGARIVEIQSGFGLSQGLSFNLFKSLLFIFQVISLKGRKGYFQHHAHLPELDNFNERGLIDSYLVISDMLKHYPDIKGIISGSWYYDPKIKNISPNLTYLRDIPAKNGAKFYNCGRDASGSAISKSQKRRKLFNEGKYVPKAYLYIWSRKKFLEWAKAQHKNAII